MIDSQTVKAPAPGAKRGYDAAKKTVGRKRHVAVDTDGRLLMVNLTPADISDNAGAQMILHAVRKRWPWIKHLFADGVYNRTQLMDKAAFLDLSSKSSAASTRSPASRSSRGAGWSSAPSAGSPAGARARLRAAPRCLRSHDPRRHGHPPAAPSLPLTTFSNGLLECGSGSDGGNA